MVAAFLLVVLVNEGGAQPPVRFNADVRPILADACFTCHGPDEKARQGELRLDTQAGLFSVSDNRTVVSPS
ncbi:MAG: hypothetical protein KF861_16080, partial [Planctomycetaceae bacterium]|nr:hypothetical protein [Planctomycetaceae bacterium]